MRLLACLLLLLPSLAARAAAGTCLSYGVPVTLTGRITIGSSYGENIHTGQVGTTRWRQITLDRPICTRADPSDPFAVAERNVRAMQPVWPGGDIMKLKVGTPVKVDGTLFHTDNGSQMTPVLISVTRLTPGR